MQQRYSHLLYRTIRRTTKCTECGLHATRNDSQQHCDKCDLRITIKSITTRLVAECSAFNKKTRLDHKQLLINYIRKHNICNDTMFEQHLRNSTTLQDLQMKLHAGQLDNYQKANVPYSIYHDRQSNIQTTKRLWYKRSTSTVLLATVARENKMSIDTLLQLLANWTFGVDPKKRGLILMGHTNSGKIVFSKYLVRYVARPRRNLFYVPTGKQCQYFYVLELDAWPLLSLRRILLWASGRGPTIKTVTRRVKNLINGRKIQRTCTSKTTTNDHYYERWFTTRRI